MDFDNFSLVSYEDLWWADWLVLGYYVLVSIILLSILVLAIQTFRRRITWGQARVMGVPFAIFGWIQFMFLFMLVDGLFGIAAVILSTPLWIDLSIAAVAIVMPLIVFLVLKRRPTFKPSLFIALVLIPLGIPGTHLLARLTKVGAIEVMGTAGLAAVKYADNAAPLAMRHMDELVDVVPVIRNLPQVSDTLAGKVRFTNTMAKGRFGDALTARRMTAIGYNKLPSKYNAINGIDGIYVRRDAHGMILNLVIIENKVDSGRLFANQMSDTWIADGLAKMAASTDALTRSTAKEVRSLIESRPNAISKELWHHDLAKGVTTVRALDADGKPGSILRTWRNSFIKDRLAETCKPNSSVCTFVTE